MKFTRERTKTRVSFCTLEVDVANATLDGRKVVGRWTATPPTLPSRTNDDLLPRFANCSEDREAILRFTQTYGPLTIPVRGRGQSFSFALRIWRQAHREFKDEWDTRPRRQRRSQWFSGRSGEFKAQGGERFRLWRDEWTYVTTTLYRLLQLQLLLTPSERLRKCRRPDCPTPYFIADHLAKRYCSNDCAGWGQRQAKQKWWKETGDVERRRKLAERQKR